MSAAMINMIVSIMNGFCFDWMVTWFPVFDRNLPKRCLSWRTSFTIYYKPL